MSFAKSSLRMETDFNLKAQLPEFSALYCNCTREKKSCLRGSDDMIKPTAGCCKKENMKWFVHDIVIEMILSIMGIFVNKPHGKYI